MQVVSYGKFNIVVSGNPHYPFFKYDSSRPSAIKVVNPRVTLNLFEDVYSSKSKKNYHGRMWYGHVAFGISVIYSFSQASCFYFCYHFQFEPLIRNNFSSLEALEVIGDFYTAKIVPTGVSASVIPADFYDDDFPFIDGKKIDFDSLPQYQFGAVSNNLISTSNNLIQTDNVDPAIQNSGPAICACGYISEFVENDPSYVCQQCKLWHHVTS